MKKNKLKTAYSLLELSIVIIIISILISGALSISITGVNSAKVRVTKDRMQEIYKALGNYLLAQRRLPCPASLRLFESTDPGYGDEAPANCVGAGVYSTSLTVTNVVYGAVPTRALGLSNEFAKDAFDSKIVYMIDPNFTVVTPFPTPSFASMNFGSTPPTGIMTIAEVNSGGSQIITHDAILVLISHGANKAGAFNPNSSSQNTRSVDANEMENDIANAGVGGTDNADFDNEIVISAANSDVFDDIVLYKTRSNFIEDFKAMFLIPCNGNLATTNFPISDNAYYGQIVSKASCVLPAIHTRKCEANSTWVNIQNDCI